MNNDFLRIAFIHPDLGIGGAERLVVDAALYLQRAGHKVTVFAGHHDKNYCFEETRDGTLDVRSYRSLFPTHIAQRLRACCALIRTSYLALILGLRGGYDIIFCDLIPHVIPILRFLTGARVVYYCHYPDSYPAQSIYRDNFFYRLYRGPIDRLEQAGIAAAARVLTNSRFTAARCRKAYPRLKSVPVEVVYPGVDPALYRAPAGRQDDAGDVTLLSINRFVRFKNIGLAIEALALLGDSLPAATFRRVRLVLLGAYDVRLRESRELLGELEAAVKKFHLQGHVDFKLSCPESERLALLSGCRGFIYTHFGFGPVEAMAAGRPVVAVASGGPMETVIDGVTGLLCPPTPRAFAAAMEKLILDPEAADRMGRAGRRRMSEEFSLESFGRRLEAVLRDVARGALKERRERTALSP